MTTNTPTHFIRRRIEEDLKNGLCARVLTRFPPEPNGFLHLGHAKAALLNFGLAKAFDGCCFLRMDDTNPEHESSEYIEAIERDVRWLGCVWDGNVRHTSDYFGQLYDYALQLINANLAYVCSLSADEIRASRGTLTQAGTNSPYRERDVAENIDYFERMRAGEYADGAHVLRAKIDMSAANLNMRDPVLYRIRHAVHPRAGKQWCIYPTYDFSHCLSDAIEGISHSLCTLEFEDHRPLYDWLLQVLKISNPPQQIEFARLNMEATVMSKRQLQTLLDTGAARGWDDPRLPTLSGLRRRGCPAAAIRDFCESIGIAKADNTVRIAQFAHSIRQVLDTNIPRAMCVLRPLRVRLSNWPDNRKTRLDLAAHPNIDSFPVRHIDFAGEFYIEQDDYSDNPPPKYRRLSLGRCVRMRGAWVIRCDSVERDQDGRPTLLHCSYDTDTLGVKPDYKIGGVIHWASVLDAVSVSVRLLGPMLTTETLSAAHTLTDVLNPDSEQVLSDCRAEPSVRDMKIGDVRQFERCGYFCVDSDSHDGRLIFNRVVELRDSWVRLSADAS